MRTLMRRLFPTGSAALDWRCVQMRASLAGLVALVGVAAAMLATPAAGGTPPLQVTDVIDSTFIDTGTCGFPVTFHVFANVHDTVFFDEEGNLDRVIESVSQGEITVSANGVTLRSAGAGATVIEFKPTGGVDYFVTHGLTANFVVPGVGPVWVEAGRSVYLIRPLRRIFEAGVTIYDSVALCAALAA